MSYITSNRNRPLYKNPSVLIAGLIILLGGITVYALRELSSSKAKAATETVIPQITTVTALGKLEPSGEIRQISVSSGAEGNRIAELLVKEGERIEAGETIAVLDSRDRLEAAVKQAEAKVKVAKANLARVLAGAKTGEINAQQATISRIQAERDNDIAAQSAMLSRMSAELNNAQIEYQRYQQLYDRGAVSASQRDSKKLILETARQQVAEAQANLNRIKSAKQQQITEAQATLDKIAEVRPVDIQVATAEVAEAESAVVTARADRDRAYIKSPDAGTVIEILTHPGEVVSSSEGIARIGKIDRMYAVAEVYESDIQKVKLGQTATITNNSLGEELLGTVDRIGLEIQRQQVVNADPTANIDGKVVQVKVRLDKESSQKVAGLTNLQTTVQINL